MSPDVLFLRTFCHCTLCLRTFCLGTHKTQIYIVIAKVGCSSLEAFLEAPVWRFYTTTHLVSWNQPLSRKAQIHHSFSLTMSTFPEFIHGHCPPTVRVLPGPRRGADWRAGGAGPAQTEAAGSQAAHHLAGRHADMYCLYVNMETGRQVNR
jgi:hypothetical protein